MTESMAEPVFVKAEDLQVGMVLAEDVVLGKHHCVACCGWVVTGNLRQHMLGYGNGALVDPHRSVTAEQLQTRQRNLEQQVTARMGDAVNQPHMQRLKAILVEHRLRQGYGD